MSTIASWFPAGTATNWEYVAIFSLNQTTNTRFYVGFEADNAGLHPNDGIWLRYDTNATFADTAFKVETCVGGVCTVGATTFAVDTAFHKIDIKSTSAGSIIFTFDGGTPETISTNITAISMDPFVLCGNDTTASLSFAKVNFAALSITGLAR